MPDRRAEFLLLCSDLVKIRLESVHPGPLLANLEDISSSGACLQLDRPLTVGTGISFRLGRHKFRGRTRYCLHNEIGYFVGIQFDASRKWSQDIYEPKHLLDPRRLFLK